MKSGIVIFLIIVAVTAVAGLVVYSAGKKQQPDQTAAQQTVPENPSAAAPTGIQAGDNTDAGLARESATVDTMLKAADQDSTAIDTGLNDQQGNLSEQ